MYPARPNAKAPLVAAVAKMMNLAAGQEWSGFLHHT